ncbi:MAG: substrate-binding domain-containing protein [Lentisphaeria bacterium]|nr:substrate-binding domain-containing protein [Lentisphaeria bacterium]
MKTVSFAHYILDHNSDKPLHLQLKEELLRQLRALPANGGYRLPSERSVVNLFQINRATVHKVYAELLESGLVKRNPNKSLSVVSGAKKQLQGAFPIIGLLVPCRFSDYVESRGQRSFQYIKGIIDRAESRKVSILTLLLPPSDSSKEVLHSFINERCAMLSGLIHLGVRSDNGNVDRSLESILNYQGIPQVFISGNTDLPHIGSVCSDPAYGAEELAAEAVRLNFRSFGMVYKKSYNDQIFKYAASKRRPAIRKALTDAGLILDEKWYVTQESDDVFDAADIPDIDHLPDLIWCSSDTLASGLVRHLRQNGVRVPEDVSVVGFNGFFLKDSPEETVATIGHPFYQIGERAVDLLLEYFEHGINSENRQILLKTVLVHGPTLRTEPLK